MAGGVLPVLKHMPGHGRATADSHQRLPVVDADRATLEATDFAAFRPLADLPLGMTAHVVFTAIDPVAPATTSATMMREVIRGFDRLRRAADERRRLDGGAVGLAGRAHARGARGRLRHRASLQRRDRRRCSAVAGRGARCSPARRARARRRGARARRRRAGAVRSSPQARGRVRRHAWRAVWQTARSGCMNADERQLRDRARAERADATSRR